MGVKSILKKNKQVYSFCSKAKNKMECGLSLVNPTLLSKLRYREVFHRKLDLKNPVRLTEKIMYLKLNKYWDNQLIADCADKYAVRKYLTRKGCPEILVGLCGAWDRVEDIDWESLPDKFVLKCNHGSGYNIVCKDKKLLNIPEAEAKLRKWMQENYGVDDAEQGIYEKIHRKIIAEEFIETEDGLPPKDYKFFCSYGKVKVLFVARDRFEDNTKSDYYYPDWTWIPVQNCHPNAGPVEKPADLERMMHYAELLSEDFPLVRVDMYNEKGKIYFGELTFTHFGGLNGFKPDEYDKVFGDLFPAVTELKQWNPERCAEES